MRIELPQDKYWVHSTQIPVRWGDMDAMQHVNNTVYFRYLEQSRIEWFHEEGFSPPKDGIGPVVVNAFCNFIRQVTYPDTLLLKMYVSDVRRTTFETWVTMESINAPGVICATGGATCIWVDHAQQKAVALPEAVRTRIEAAMAQQGEGNG